MIQWFRRAIQKLNEIGIPLPLFRINGRPTLTGTMTVISFNTALFGQIGKVTKVLGDIDLTSAISLFGVCLAAYLGRRIQAGDVKIEGSSEEDKK